MKKRGPLLVLQPQLQLVQWKWQQNKKTMIKLKMSKIKPFFIQILLMKSFWLKQLTNVITEMKMMWIWFWIQRQKPALLLSQKLINSTITNYKTWHCLASISSLMQCTWKTVHVWNWPSKTEKMPHLYQLNAFRDLSCHFINI